METEDRYRTARGLRSKIITQRNTKYRESSQPGDSLCCCMSCSSLIQISIITGIFIIVFLPAIVRIITSAGHEMPTISESVIVSPPIHNGAFWRYSFQCAKVLLKLRFERSPTSLKKQFTNFLGCAFAAEPHRPMFFRRLCCLVILSSYRLVLSRI